MLERATAKGHSVCLSVRLSACHASTVQDIETLFALYERAMLLVS